MVRIVHSSIIASLLIYAGTVFSALEYDRSKAIYYPVRPAILVNLSGHHFLKYLQVKIDLVTYDERVLAALEFHAPLVQDQLVEMYSRLQPMEYLAKDRRDLFELKTIETINQTLRNAHGVPNDIEGVEAVIFRQLILE